MPDELVERLQQEVPRLELELRTVERKLAFIGTRLRRMNSEGQGLVGDLTQRAGRLRTAVTASKGAIAALSSLAEDGGAPPAAERPG